MSTDPMRYSKKNGFEQRYHQTGSGSLDSGLELQLANIREMQSAGTLRRGQTSQGQIPAQHGVFPTTEPYAYGVGGSKIEDWIEDTKSKFFSKFVATQKDDQLVSRHLRATLSRAFGNGSYDLVYRAAPPLVERELVATAMDLCVGLWALSLMSGEGNKSERFIWAGDLILAGEVTNRDDLRAGLKDDSSLTAARLEALPATTTGF